MAMVLLFFIIFVTCLLTGINFLFFLFTGKMFPRHIRFPRRSRENEGILDSPMEIASEKGYLAQDQKGLGGAYLPGEQPQGKYSSNIIWFILLGGVSLVVSPALFVSIWCEHDCCSRSNAIFSPDHKAGVYLIYGLAVAAYFYSSIRTKLGPPILEVLSDSFMILGFILNFFVALQIDEVFMVSLGNIAPAMLFVLRLSFNHLLVLDQKSSLQEGGSRGLKRLAISLLQRGHWKKYPLLVLLALSFLPLLSLLLFLLGQNPNALVLAFTETYKYRFSQLECLSWQCS